MPKEMGKKAVQILQVIALIAIITSTSYAAADKGDEKKVYHNEKWDLMLLYPDGWTYTEEYRDNVPVVMYPPEDKGPDGFVMAYFLGEKVFKDIDEFKKHFEEKYLASYEKHEIIVTLLSETKEGYKAIDYRYTYVDDEKKTFVCDCRLTITATQACWMMSYDRPKGGSEAVEKEAQEIMQSIIFAATDYLTKEE